MWCIQYYRKRVSGCQPGFEYVTYAEEKTSEGLSVTSRPFDVAIMFCVAVAGTNDVVVIIAFVCVAVGLAEFSEPKRASV